jgi:hypothetical protein
LVVISPSVAKTFLLDRIQSGLGEKCVAVFDSVKPHSPNAALALSLSERRDPEHFTLVRPLRRLSHPKQHRDFDSTIVRLTLRRYGAIALDRKKMG